MADEKCGDRSHFACEFASRPASIAAGESGAREWQDGVVAVRGAGTDQVRFGDRLNGRGAVWVSGLAGRVIRRGGHLVGVCPGRSQTGSSTSIWKPEVLL